MRASVQAAGVHCRTVPLDALGAFARKKIGKDQLLRALCEHDKWFVPIDVATAAMTGKTFECLSVWGAVAKVPAGHLYLFTDVEAGQRAAKTTSLGPYASPVAGAELFRHLPPGVTEVHVNPGSASERSWFFGGDWVELSRRWGAAVVLERLLAGKRKRELTQELIDFGSFSTLRKADGTLATAAGKGKLKNPAMVFTAPDCCDAALKAAGADAKSWKRITGSGKQLFTAFSNLGVDGLVLNPHGPGPTKTLDEAFCWGVVSAIAAREKA